MINEQNFDGNHLENGDNDLFGFTEAAKRISSAVLQQTGDRCIVLGLEGEWGSGKSSLLAMLRRCLEKQSASVVRFEPWMVGSREALIAEMLAGLNAAVERLKGTDVTEKAQSVLQQLGAYAGGLTVLSRLAGLAGDLGMPGGSIAAEILSKTSETLKESGRGQPLVTLKEKLNEALKKLSTRIVVLIDDIDRLEPKEAVEVLRLMQSVADFPSLTYVLCYDRTRLAESITKVTGLEDGASYLEKIVQVVFPVPRPQPSALRRMFITRLKAITSRDELGERLSHVLFDHVGVRLRTPRAIVRALDGLRLLWPALADKVDLADLVWLQFVRNEDVQLYRWIEEYVAAAAVPPSGISETKALQLRLQSALDELIAPGRSLGLEWQELRSFLPMVSMTSDSSQDALFVRQSRDEALQAYKSKRLSSPDHARLYFGFLRPEGAMPEDTLQSFLESCYDSKRTEQTLIELSRTSARSGLAKIEIVLDQLGTAIDRMEDAQVMGLVGGLLSVADELVANAREADSTVFRQSLGRLLKGLSDRQDKPDWSAWLQAALDQANAVDFITDEIRLEAQQPTLDWAGTGLEGILKYLVGQYAKIAPGAFWDRKQPVKILSIWHVADVQSEENFLKNVFSNDEYLTLFVTNFYAKFANGSEISRFERSLFQKYLENYFEIEMLTIKLKTLAASATDERKKRLEAVLAAL